MGSRDGEDLWQSGGWRTGVGSGWWSGWSHICGQGNWEEQLERETDHATQGLSTEKENLKTAD